MKKFKQNDKVVICPDCDGYGCEECDDMGERVLTLDEQLDAYDNAVEDYWDEKKGN